MNIVKFHGFWQDRTKNDDRPRVNISMDFIFISFLFFFNSIQVVFITEYMSSGSLKHLLRKTKKTKQSLSKNSWRRWCIQLLSALKYVSIRDRRDCPTPCTSLPRFALRTDCAKATGEKRDSWYNGSTGVSLFPPWQGLIRLFGVLPIHLELSDGTGRAPQMFARQSVDLWFR